MQGVASCDCEHAQCARLQLELQELAVRARDLPQADGAAVAELPRPIPELVAAVALRPRLPAGQHTVCTEWSATQRPRGS